jgi:signal transduction histidine kinase
LPAPQKEPFQLEDLIRRVANLDTRLRIQVAKGYPIQINADAAQVEQLLINILHNAVDASLETGGGVTIGWRELGECVEIYVHDEGHGIMNATNLFVPFFTTKPGGSGIGLTLSRQIAEAHGGSLTLQNRKSRSGCEALLRLPK